MRFLLDHDVPDDLSYLLEQLGHEVVFGRKALPEDFLQLASAQAHQGIVIVIPRRTRADESAGETGLRNNVDFA
ncbi:MAG: hypothetical protein NTV52_17040 [Acidobacteria bacterium]|nr:hypothetical protein [Acidobacteriota bacterium]